MIYREVTESIIRNREKRLRGELIAIPWSLRRLNNIIPGVEQGKYVLISANPKAGKTQLADYLYVYEPVEWYLKNKEKVSLKIIYFSLEMSRGSKVLQAMSYKLSKEYDISISPQNLKSSFEKYILDEGVLKIINSPKFQVWLNEFETAVTFVDNVRSPNKIYNYVRQYAEKNGKFLGSGDFIRYIPDNPDEYVIIIVDHLSLLSPDTGSLFDAIYDYSAYKCLEFRDKYNYCVINVQQQSADSAKQIFDYRGNSVIEKIRPTADGLADCRLTSRDVNLMISLFNPASYNLDIYEQIDLRRIGRWHRELYVNLNRDGYANAMVQLYFNGAVNEFAELPYEMTEDAYNNIENKVSKLIN